MLIEIKNRFTGKLIYSLDCENNTIKLTVKTAIKLKVNLFEANLSWANLSGANLSWVDLSGSNLSWANLSGANLSWVDLSGSNLSWANGNNKEIKTIHTGFYIINYTKTHMQIGCQKHLISDWFKFTDSEINGMDEEKALNFWKKWKPILKQIMEIE
jgi:uncharacterized protein YjbI with pentapeptide repeats